MTRLWLATILVADNESEVRAQRLCIADAGETMEQVKADVAAAIQDIWYVDTNVESVVQIDSLTTLASSILGLDLVTKTQVKSIGDPWHPTRLDIEVVYDDFGEDGQMTPSRIECLMYPSRIAAAQAAEAVSEHSRERWPDRAQLVHAGLSSEDTISGHAETDQDACDFLDGMMAEIYSDEDEDEDEEDDE